MDSRKTLLLCGALWACKRGSGGEGSEEDFEPLETVSGAFDGWGEIVENSCGRDIADDLEDLRLKFDQVATGLSIFYDPDIGWIPCEGSIEEFDCRWGNAPSDTPAGSWSWRLVGSTMIQDVEATLTLTVSCQLATGDCESCELVQRFEGSLED
jgi:hypothetical protein